MAASLAVREFLHSGYPGQLVSFHRTLFLHAFSSLLRRLLSLVEARVGATFFFFTSLYPDHSMDLQKVEFPISDLFHRHLVLNESDVKFIRY